MRKDNTSYEIAICALMAALAIVFMLLSSLIPVLTYVSPMLASLTLIPVLYESGKKYAWMTWGVTTALALMLCADREAALFSLFLGYYPIIKPGLDRIKTKPHRVMTKLVVFTTAISFMVLTLTFAVGLNDLKEDLWLNIAFYTMMIAVLFLFDRTYSSMTVLYEKRLRRLLVRHEYR